MPEDRNQDQNRNEQRQSRSASDGGRSPAGAPEHSLESREYRDKDGNIHHHTNTYMEQHKGETRR